jgi:DNA (cytosine-5)-methyltransferase 1
LSAGWFDLPAREREAHRGLVLRHIDLLGTLLAADQELQPWTPACGCPHASPEQVARSRKKSGGFPCQYTTLSRYEEPDAPRLDTEYQSSCVCRDPLVDSDDPLDAVAAVALATNGLSIAERYVSRRWRAVIAGLREQYGTWEVIAALSRAELARGLKSVSSTGVSPARVDRLHELLEQVAADDRTDGVSLRDLGPRAYRFLHEMLASYTGVSGRDAWWLLLTAFDKPVWPADPAIDRLLCDLGLLDPADAGTGGRHRELETALVDRQIPALHRVLAGHAARGQRHFSSKECEVRKFSLTYRARRQASHHDAHDGPVAVDLFSGAGGFSYGLLEAGYDIALAIDSDRDATDTYCLNHPEIPYRRIQCEDIEELLDRDDWLDLLPQPPDVVVGGPPCQSFSLAGYRSRWADDGDYSIRDDPRTGLYTHYLDAVNRLRPKAIVVENVEGMADEIGDSDDRVVDQVIEALETASRDDEPTYVTDYTTVDCSAYGIPQRRKRIIIFGVREDLADSGRTPDSFFDVLTDRQSTAGDDRPPYHLRHALSGLPKLRQNEGGDVVLGKPAGSLSDYVAGEAAPYRIAGMTDLSLNHRAREHPKRKDCKLFEVMDPGDTGWDVKYSKAGGKWSALIEYDVGTEENPAFSDKYRMIHWNEPAPTVVAHLAKDANNYLLPDYYKYANPDGDRRDPARNRGVTPREAARVQSFPDDYLFLGPFTEQFRQIGNAVPPVLAWHLAGVIDETIMDLSAETPVNKRDRPPAAASDD